MVVVRPPPPPLPAAPSLPKHSGSCYRASPSSPASLPGLRGSSPASPGSCYRASQSSPASPGSSPASPGITAFPPWALGNFIGVVVCPPCHPRPRQLPSLQAPHLGALLGRLGSVVLERTWAVLEGSSALLDRRDPVGTGRRAPDLNRMLRMSAQGCLGAHGGFLDRLGALLGNLGALMVSFWVVLGRAGKPPRLPWAHLEKATMRESFLKRKGNL